MFKDSIFSNKPFLFILFSAFLSIMGIGIIIPVVPFIVQQYIPSHNLNQIALTVGFLTSLYAFCQFFAAPVLGAMSDRFGRRPVLLLCLLGSAIGYVFFGIGGSLTILYIGRIIDGITGGDISTMFAYIADITPPQERGKYYGIIGATIGFGFMIGPTIGGLLSHFGLSAPFYVAAGVTLLNIIFGFFVLPESLDKKHRLTNFTLSHLNPIAELTRVIKKANIRTLLIVGVYYYLPFALMSGFLGIYYKDIIHFTPSDIGYIFLLLGIGDMFTQGFLSGKLLPTFGEMKLVISGFLLTGIAFAIIALLPLYPFTWLVYVYTIIYALGSGLFEPSFSALISHTAEPHEQGRVQGASQSMQSITRIIGPLLAVYTYRFFPSAPFIIGAVLSGVGIVYLYWQKSHKLKK